MRQVIFIASTLIICCRCLAQSASQRFDSLSNEYEKNNYPGVILVAREDKIIYSKAFGYADLDKKIKLTTRSLFKTESTGKMYTAFAIMQLMERGKLRPDQTIKEILPELNIANADKITIHHLLTHTSGLQSPWDNPHFDFKKIYTREEMEKIITGLPLVFNTPGERMYYSNSGFIVLSWIVEKISGLPFDTYLARHFFVPQKMTRIHHLNDTIMPPGEAQPYRFLNSKKYIHENETVGPRASGAGGWIASAADLYRFMEGIDRHKYINAATLQMMITANHTIRTDSLYHYGYGLEIYSHNPIKNSFYFGHSGGGAGFSIDAILDTTSHFIVVFCSNIFMNSRDVTSNYLRAALGLPAEKILVQPAIKVYDRIETTGIDDFILHAKENFKSLGIEPDDRLFTNVGDAMDEAKDDKVWAKWMELGAALFPANGFILMMAGEAESRIGEKEKAKKSYEDAKAIAIKNNDSRMKEAAQERLEGLGRNH